MRNHRILGWFLGCLTLAIAISPQIAEARIEAVKGKKYRLTERHGPWMIMVASMSGENAGPAADALVYELRRKGIPAYAHKQDREYDQINTFDRYGRIQQRAYTAQDGRVGVIAGNYKNINNTIAQKTLDYVKRMYPRSLGGGVYFKTPGRPMPFSGAFLTVNPLLSPEEVARRQKDPLLLKLNSGTDLSLLDNPGKYTLVVKTYYGKSITELAKDFDAAANNFQVSDALDQAAKSAWELANVLKRHGHDAYVFHDHNRSIVTVGSFNQEKGDPEALRLFKIFQAKAGPNAPPGSRGISAEILRPPGVRKDDPNAPMWILDPTPYLMAVPRLK